MISQRILDYIASKPYLEPRLVLDVDMVAERYEAFEALLPSSKVFYAVKANPTPEILQMLAKAGSYFDCASMGEIRDVLAAGGVAERISYGNTIKKERDIAQAFELGVALFAVDCDAEVDKIARVAPGSRVIARILCDNAGAEWPLSRKFGCEPEDAVPLLKRAADLGLQAYGVAFHVGSQQKRADAWEQALADTARIFRELAASGLQLKAINLGGGFPSRAGIDAPLLSAYGDEILKSLKRHFGDAIPELMIEPGRGLVADAGVIETEVVLISQKHVDEAQWVYLDIGKFGGLAETMDEAIRYPISTPRDGDGDRVACILAGPTCDSVDVLYEKTPYMLPRTLAIGDRVLIEAAGAYTSAYSTVCFNGIAPLAVIAL
jgi:ornithine decarboxylase